MKLTSLLFTSSLLVGSVMLCQAQGAADSVYFDLGRTLLRKDFTISVEAKGEDLSRHSYGTTAEAIQSYFGIGDLVYVVDGQVVSDINNYSIFDIRQISVLDHAVGVLHGAQPYSKLALIETYSATGQYGDDLRVAARVGWGAAVDEFAKAGVQQQYYLMAQGGTRKLRGGLSLDYTTDRNPYNAAHLGLEDANSLDYRVILRGYGQYSLSEDHHLSADAHYAPNHLNNDQVWNTVTWNGEQTQFSLTGRVRLDSRFGDRLGNTFSVSHSWSELDTERIGDDPAGIALQRSTATRDYFGRQTFLQNRTVYRLSAGDLEFSPQLAVTWRMLSGQESTLTASQTQYSQYSVKSTSVGFEVQHRLVMAPAMDVRYRDIAWLKGGVHLDFSAADFFLSDESERSFPFVSAGWQAVNSIFPDSRWGLLFTGSYAQSGNFSDETTGQLFDRLSQGSEMALRPPFNTDRTTGTYWQAAGKVSYNRDLLFAQYGYGKTDYPAWVELSWIFSA